MPMNTIDDLKKADRATIQEYLDKVTIKQDLQEWIQYLNESRDKTHIGFTLGGGGTSRGIYPSSACKKAACQLQMYYDCTREVDRKRFLDLQSQNTFDTGDALHGVLQQYLNDMYGDQFKDEVRLTDEILRISSRTDGIFTFSDYRFILEIKTIKEGGSFGFEKVQTKPMLDHLRQTVIYMKLANVPMALIYYWCKNNGKVKEHAVIYDEKIWNEVVDLVTPIVDAAFHGGPPVAANPGSTCRFCDYKHGCPEIKVKRRKKNERIPRSDRKQFRRGV